MPDQIGGMSWDEVRQVVEDLYFALSESHYDEVKANHHGDSDDGCSYCAALERARAFLGIEEG